MPRLTKRFKITVTAPLEKNRGHSMLKILLMSSGRPRAITNMDFLCLIKLML